MVSLYTRERPESSSDWSIMGWSLPVRIAVCLVLSARSVFGSALELEQELVIGFPVDGVNSVVPYVVGREGHHRLAITHSQYLLGLQWSPQSNTYEERFFVQGDFDGIAIMADVDGDRINEIVVIDTFDEKMSAWNATTGVRLASFKLEVDARGGAAQDLDGVPGDELIVTTREGISAYKGGVLFWQSRTAPETQVTAGGEGSATRDILIRTNQEIAMLDARTGVERRRYPIRCPRAAVGQTDSDESLEIACYSYDLRAVSIVDANTGNVQWTHQEWLPFFDVRSIAMVNAGGDGRQDVAIRTYSTGVSIMVVLNGVTGEPISGVRELVSGGVVSSVTIDCESAIVVTEGGGTTAPDKLYLIDPRTLNTKAAYSFDSFGIKGLAVADLNGDERNEMIVHHSGKTTTLSVQPFFRDDVTEGVTCCGFGGMATAQLDGDRPLEYVLTGVLGYTGTITAFDGVTHEKMWMGVMDDGEVPRSVEIADLNGDGQRDVLSATVAVHSGAKGQFVYAFDGAIGRTLWRSVNIGGLTGKALVADMDANGTPEVLALSRSVGIVQLDATNGSVRGFDEFTGGNAFAVLNADGDAQLEVLVATEGQLIVRDQGQKTMETSIDSHWGVSTMKVVDIDGDGTVEILLVRQNSFDGLRLEVRARDLALLWSSEIFPTLLNFQQEATIVFADIDNDGAAEVVLTSSLAVRVFRIGARPVDAIAPRFSPAATLTSDVLVLGSCCASVHLQWNEAETDASPPLAYAVYRSGPSPQDAEVYLGTTLRNEFVDASAGGGTRYRYSVRVTDNAGNTATERLTTDVSIRAVSTCRRRAVRP